MTGGLTGAIQIKDDPLTACSIEQLPGLPLVGERTAEQIIEKERAESFDRRLGEIRQKARERGTGGQLVPLKQGHERDGKGLEPLVEGLQGAFPADGVPEEDHQKIDHLVASEAPPRKTHPLIDLSQDSVLAQMRRHQYHFAKPGGGRGNALGRGLDDYRSIGDTGHMYLLEGMGCFSLSKRHIFILTCYPLAARCASRGTKERKEYLWGYGSGIVSATIPGYGDVVLAEFTQPFNESDVSYYLPLFIQAVAVLGRFPLHVTADAAYDAWYVYQTCAHREGIAAIPLNTHGHEDVPRDRDGVPLCPIGLRMHPTYRFLHTKGYHAQRYRCPLLFPQRTGQTCAHEQFQKDKGCVKDINIEKGVLMRAMLDRSSPLYRAVYRQRTSAERINSQAKARGIERPKVRQGDAVRRLNTLTYILINLKALARARAINAALLTPKLGKLA